MTSPAAETSRNDSIATSKPPPCSKVNWSTLCTRACGIQRAAERETGEREPADRTLLDHPGDVLGMTLLEQDPWHRGRDAEPEIDGGVDLQLGGGAPGDDLLQTELHRLDVLVAAVHLTGQRRIVEGLGGLHLVRRDDDRVDQYAGHVDVLGPQLIVGQPLDLGDHDAAVVVGGVGLVEGAQSATLLLVGQIPVRVRGGGADDGDVHLHRGIEEVLAAADRHQLDEVSGDVVHLRALDPRVGVGAEADLGEHAGLAGRCGPVHLEQHPGRDVVGLDLAAVDALPDQRRVQLRAARGVRAGEHAGELPRRAEVVDALDAVHVAGGDRMDGGQVRRASGRRVAGADRLQHGVGAAQAGRGGDGDDGVVADQLGRFAG